MLKQTHPIVYWTFVAHPIHVEWAAEILEYGCSLIQSESGEVVDQLELFDCKKKSAKEREEVKLQEKKSRYLNRLSSQSRLMCSISRDFF